MVYGCAILEQELNDVMDENLNNRENEELGVEDECLEEEAKRGKEVAKKWEKNENDRRSKNERRVMKKNEKKACIYLLGKKKRLLLLVLSPNFQLKSPLCSHYKTIQIQIETTAPKGLCFWIINLKSN